MTDASTVYRRHHRRRCVSTQMVKNLADFIIATECLFAATVDSLCSFITKGARSGGSGGVPADDDDDEDDDNQETVPLVDGGSIETYQNEYERMA